MRLGDATPGHRQSQSNAASSKKALARADESGASTSKSAPQIGEVLRIGKDEMNLIERPFAVLSRKEAKNSMIHFEWEARHPISGKALAASWRVLGHSILGLPNFSGERIYLVLMELTREAGFDSQTVHFTRYEMLKRLGWKDDGRAYKMLEEGLERLKGVTIFAKNAFWNPKHKTYVNTGFNIIDHYSVKAELPGRKAGESAAESAVSFWKWSDTLFESFQAGYIRTLDLGFALSLQGDIALRLYRYLDKKAYGGRDGFEIELVNLCVNHLGLKPTPFASKFKERLKGAHDELLEKGFLSAVAYEEMKSKKGVKVCYQFGPGITRNRGESEGEDLLGELLELPLSPLPDEDAPELPLPTVRIEERRLNAPPALGAFVDKAFVDESAQSETTEFSDEQRELLARMEKIKVSSSIARELVVQFPLLAIRNQLECLDERKPKSRAATFVKSVREMWALPETYVSRLEAQERAESRRMELELQESHKAAQEALNRRETALQDEENVRLDTMWGNLDDLTRQRLDVEAKAKLGILGTLGRGEVALTAFRRAAIRDLMEQL